MQVKLGPETPFKGLKDGSAATGGQDTPLRVARETRGLRRAHVEASTCSRAMEMEDSVTC